MYLTVAYPITRRAVVFASYSVPPDLEFVSLSLLVLETAAVRGLFGAIAADRHAAPSSRLPPAAVGKHQGAAVTLARFHNGKIFFAHQLRQCLTDRQHQRLGRSPAPHHAQFQTVALVTS